MNEHIKVAGASVVTATSVVVAWLPMIEEILKMGVSVAGIIAAIYTARYWHKRTKMLGQERKDKE